MAASFPGAVRSFTTKNTGGTIEPNHINDLQDEVTAIEQAWLQGASPLNSSNSTFANLSVPGGSTLANLVMSGVLQLRGQVLVGSSAASTPFMRHDSTAAQWQIGAHGLARFLMSDGSSGVSTGAITLLGPVVCSTHVVMGNGFEVFSTQGGGVMHIRTRATSTPAAPSTGAILIYGGDSGGKTQLLVRFATGAVQVLATEP